MANNCQVAVKLDPVIGVLRCDLCGKAIDCSYSEAMEFLFQNEWPMCCTFVMMFSAVPDFKVDFPDDDEVIEGTKHLRVDLLSSAPI